MKVLLVNGSPHKNGCTNEAIKEACRVFEEEGIATEVFWIGTKAISGCTSCGSCTSKGKCIIDDKVNEFVEKAKEADGFVFGTPVHYAGVAGSMTSFMDRVFYSAFCGKKGENFRYKPVGSIISARRSGTTATYDQLNKYFGICEMPIISSRYWNAVHGNTPDEVLKDEEGLQTIRILVKNMIYFLRCIEAGKKENVALPKPERKIQTNFIR